jgi:hypothetical protein
MQRKTHSRWNAISHRLPDQIVAKGQPILVDGGEQVGRDDLVERRPHLLVRPPKEVSQVVRAEQPIQGRGDVEEVARLGAEPRDPVVDDFPHLPGWLLGQQPCPAAGDGDAALVAQSVQERSDKQRIPRRTVSHGQ